MTKFEGRREKQLKIVAQSARAIAEIMEMRLLLSGNPSVQMLSPTNGATGVSPNTAIAADLVLPNGGLDETTINSSDVYLTRNSDHSLVPSLPNTTGGGDAIILQPQSPLTPNTSYTFTITAGVKDVNGDTFTPFTSMFTTGSASGTGNSSASFQEISLATAQNNAFTCVRIGPDGLLYGSTEDGRIFRWAINGDGTLGTPQIITSLQQANGGNRLISGFTFDPSSTASNVKLWVSHTFYALSGATNGVDFTGKLTVMSGPDLGTVQDAVIDLPRSVADHVNNQPVFGPDGALYFAQAAENAFGAPDTTWGNRPDHMLSAAILRLDTTKVTPGSPLDVLTPDAGGTYDPFAANAPLTIYATGVRNAFQIMFDSHGNLWAPSNGSSSGGNSPAFSSTDPSQVNGNRIDTGQPYNGPNVPGLTSIQDTENDFLYKIAQGGYYGHPDPARGEFVLDGGNPSTPSGLITQTFSAYPSGTNPDPNYRGAAYNFGPHHSPDGIIQYTGSEFNGALNGVILVSYYTANAGIVALNIDANGNVTGINSTIPGFMNLKDPVNMVENPANGDIYVSELGADRLSLLVPIVNSQQLTAPANPQAIANNSHKVTFSWDAVSNATSYRVERQGPGDANFVEIASGITGTSYVDTNVQDGAYQYRVRAQNSSGLSGYSGVAAVNVQPPAGRQTLDIIIGKGANKSVRFVDADGTVTTFTQSGAGTTTIEFSGDTISQATIKGVVVIGGTNVTADTITGAGTNQTSGLTINAKGGNGSVDVGSITTNGTYKSITARTTNLLDNLSNSAAVGNVIFGSISGANISAASLGNLQVMGNANLVLNAGFVRTVQVHGTLSNSTLTLTGAGTVDLAKLTAGGVTGSMITATGNLGALNVGSLLNSQIYAGIATLSSGLPQTSTDFVAQDLIKSINIKKAKGLATFINSDIAAAQIQTANLGNVQFSNGGTKFGLAAHLIKSVTIGDPTTNKSVGVHNITTSATVSTALTAKGINVGDLVVNII